MSTSENKINFLKQMSLASLLEMAGFDATEILIDPAKRLTFYVPEINRDGAYATVIINPQGDFESAWRDGKNSDIGRNLSSSYRYTNLHRKFEHIEDVRKVIVQEAPAPLPMVAFDINSSTDAVVLREGNHFSYAVFAILRDMGFTAVPIVVPTVQILDFRIKFGSPENSSQRLDTDFLATYEDALLTIMQFIPAGTLLGSYQKKERIAGFVPAWEKQGETFSSEYVLTDGYVCKTQLLTLCKYVFNTYTYFQG